MVGSQFLIPIVQVLGPPPACISVRLQGTHWFVSTLWTKKKHPWLSSASNLPFPSFHFKIKWEVFPLSQIITRFIFSRYTIFYIDILIHIYYV